MRINIYTEGLQLTSELRAYVDSRLLTALGRFCDQIESGVVRLRVTHGRTVSDTTSADVVVSLYPSGEVRARAQAARLDKAIDRVAKDIGLSVENALSPSQSQPPSVPYRVTEKAIGPSALEVVLDGNRISQHQREMLERPENYLRPVVVREYWRPPGAENDGRPQEQETAVTIPRSR